MTAGSMGPFCSEVFVQRESTMECVISRLVELLIDFKPVSKISSLNSVMFF